MMKETSYSKMVSRVQHWQKLPVAARVKILDELVARLMDTSPTPVSEPNDMIVNSRIKSGQVVELHGVVLSHDVYIAGGRMAWAIEELLRVEGLPEITEGQNKAARAAAARQIAIAVTVYRNGVQDAAAPAAQTQAK